MSTHTLYHTFGLRGVQCHSRDFFKGTTRFRVSLHPNSLIYPVCRSRRVIRYGSKRRVFKALPVGRRPMKLEVTNRKIGLLRQQACGYRDEQYLNLRILHLPQSICSLAGWTFIFI